MSYYYELSYCYLGDTASHQSCHGYLHFHDSFHYQSLYHYDTVFCHCLHYMMEQLDGYRHYHRLRYMQDDHLGAKHLDAPLYDSYLDGVRRHSVVDSSGDGDVVG